MRSVWTSIKNSFLNIMSNRHGPEDLLVVGGTLLMGLTAVILCFRWLLG